MIFLQSAVLMIPACCLQAVHKPGEIEARAPVEWRGLREAPVWSEAFGTGETDWTTRVIELRDGTVATAGFVNRPSATSGTQDWDIALRRFGPDGFPVWTRRIGGPGLDAGWAVRETAAGGLAVAGPSSTGEGSSDFLFLLADANGRITAEHRYGGPDEETPTDLISSRDGGYLMIGWTRSFGSGERDVYLVRVDSLGRELWSRAYGGPGVDRGFYGVETEDGGFVIAGVTGEADNYDYLLMKVDRGGDPVWRQVVGGEGNDPNHGIALLPGGRILFLGYTESWGSAVRDISAITFSPDGELISHELIGGPDDDRVQSAAAAPDGSVWITGYTRSFGSGGWDILVARLGSDGAFEPWIGAIGTPYNDNAYSIGTARNGDLLIGGYTNAPSAGASPPDAFAMRVRPDAVIRRTEGVTLRRAEAARLESPSGAAKRTDDNN